MKVLSVNSLIFLVIKITLIHQISCMSKLAERVLQDLPSGYTIRLNYEEYVDYLNRNLRDDLNIQLIPVRQWAYKPQKIDVTDSPLIDLFGEHVMGLTLYLDNRTQRYRLPEFADISEDDRLGLVWFNNDTYENYCVDRIGRVNFFQNIKIFGRVVCTDDYDRDRCCGEEDTCQCIRGSFGCACINEEDQARKLKLWEEQGQIIEKVVEKGVEMAAKVMIKKGK